MPDNLKDAYRLLSNTLASRGLNVDRMKQRMKAVEIETPSWGYSDSGTRFGVFRQPGAASTIEEKLADAGQVQRFTGVAPLIALHVLWDLDVQAREHDCVLELAKQHGVRIGAMNPNVFQDQEYALGSITNHCSSVRKRAIRHMIDSVEIGKALHSDVLSLWFADGTNYPGEADFRERKHWAQESLVEVYRSMPPNMRMLIEYKPFEPGFYHTDIADWGMAFTFAQGCGDRAHVLVDLGHHLHGANIEHIVAFLIDEERLGGFHFNNRKYADDDLTVATVNPLELFLIYNELVKAEDHPNGNPPIAYMVDQSHNTKLKIPAMIQTINQIQIAHAKALSIDRAALARAQRANDLVGAETVIQEAFNTDVQPLIRVVREEMGLDPDPLRAYNESGYQEKITAERGMRRGSGGLGQS
ncbi:MAG TPA: TIM barrel protein [Armatimonadota bacterium]|nr:TIM barrel protein [Armatimonadota bacterium]